MSKLISHTNVVEIEIEVSKLILLSLYRAPTGDFNRLTENLDDTLKYLYKPKTEFLICGDINTYYLTESNQKKQLSLLLTTYNLSHTVNFATRKQNRSSTAIDNISYQAIIRATVTRNTENTVCQINK
jgi:hypothetical protein